MTRRHRISSTLAIDRGLSLAHAAAGSQTRVRCASIQAAAGALVVAFLLCLCGSYGWSQQKDEQRRQNEPKQDKKARQNEQQPKQKKQDDKEQMRGLDEQIQEIKSDVLRMTAELSQLEEKLLYPSGTQVAIFVSLAKDDTMRLDAVRLKIDDQPAAHYIYSFKELEALRKGGVQRIYVGNVATGEHKLEVVVDGKLEGGADFSHTENFAFRKEVKPKLVGLTLAGPNSGNAPISLGEW